MSKCFMYDLTVEDSPTYVVSGCITHNTTWALNMFYRNTYENGYNGVYVSLEVPKQDVMYNLWSLHSSQDKFSKYPFIAHDRIRKGLLTKDEEEYLFDVVVPDLESSKGKMIILDETDFKNFSYGEIRDALEKADDSCNNDLDMVFWDHANLFKFFMQGSRNLSTGEVINQYVSFIRRLSIRFRKSKDTGEWRQLINVILAQCNRTGWQKAVKNQGRYTLTALSEANELERCASYVLMVFTDENMKISREASVQLLKSRYGQTIYDPVNVFADPEAYVFGEASVSAPQEINEAMFDQMFDVDPEAMGMTQSPRELDLSEFKCYTL